MPIAVLALGLMCLAPPLHAQRASERYDDTFRKYGKRFFGVAFDWRLFKAQAITESNLDTAATSWVGARGHHAADAADVPGGPVPEPHLHLHR